MEPNLAMNPYFQAGIVGLFMTFSLSLVGIFIRHINAKDKDNRTEHQQRDEKLDHSNKSWQTFFEQQNTLWRGFLEGERAQRKEIMDSAYSTFSENMQRIASGLGVLTKELNDTHMDLRLRQETILSAIETINGGKG